MVTKEVNNENPNEHWEFIECKNVIAVDLGCGRWEHTEYRDPSWPTTPEFLIQRGASHVYAFDIDQDEIKWYNANVTPNMNVTPINMRINSVDDIRHIYNTYKPKTIKCDIEGAEYSFLELTDEEFCSVDFYAIETHSDDLFSRFNQQFEKLNYKIIAHIDLVHARPMKVIFAKKYE
jgi:hypothetical protein